MGTHPRRERKYAQRLRAFEGVLAVAVLVIVGATLPQISRAASLSFPGVSPCDTTLQLCIDGAAPGDVVEIATNGPIDESPRIEKSLTLRAAPGFSPLLSDFNTVLAIAPTGGGDVAITIQGITIERGNMTAIHGTTGQFDLTIVDNEIQDGSFNGGIGVRTGTGGDTRGPLVFNIARNRVVVPQGSSNQVDAISVGAFKGSTYDGRIADNRILMNRTVDTQGGAILVFSVEGTGTVDVVGNVVSGTLYNNGIFIRPDFGSVEARVINNQVSGQTNVAGQPGAIAASSNVDGVVVTILNNTVVDNEIGLFISGRADLGESVSGIVVNNVIARSGVGLSIDSDFEGTVANRNNLLFANGSNFFVPGPGTVFENPLFLGPDDFHLAAGSPAIDAGDDSAVPPDITTDIDGGPRIRDGNSDGTAVVDIGAYEAAPSTNLVSAVLPGSRSVQVGIAATAFGTIINAGSQTAIGCSIAPITAVPASFLYQTTDPATNALTGTANTPVDIAAGASQSYVFAFTPTAAFAPTDVQLTFGCTNTDTAPITSGLNTLLLSASSIPIPDIVADAVTVDGDGIVKLASTGIFAVATVNVGVAGTITVSADTGSATLPVSVALCETNPATGVCINPTVPTSAPVTTSIAANATPTFAFFVTGTASVPFDPANNRIFVRFRDVGGETRGSTSVAVQTL